MTREEALRQVVEKQAELQRRIREEAERIKKEREQEEQERLRRVGTPGR
jgi:hypothetical protein